MNASARGGASRTNKEHGRRRSTERLLHTGKPRLVLIPEIREQICDRILISKRLIGPLKKQIQIVFCFPRVFYSKTRSHAFLLRRNDFDRPVRCSAVDEPCVHSWKAICCAQTIKNRPSPFRNRVKSRSLYVSLACNAVRCLRCDGGHLRHLLDR